MTKNKTLLKRMGVTLLILALYQIAITVPLPNLSVTVANSSLLNLLNITSGGGFTSLTLFALGLTPYITATIITQLLTSGVSKTMTLWSEQGTAGRTKINTVTKTVMIVLALIQAPALIFALKQLQTIGAVGAVSWKTYVFATLIVTAGASMAKFMGDELNRHGLGNGASLLIAANIAAGLPDTVKTVIQLFSSKQTQPKAWIAILVFVVGVLAIVFMELTERRLRIQAARQTQISSKKAYLPIKLNPAGMIPVIFAGGLISIAHTLSTLATSNKVLANITHVLGLDTTSGKIIYAAIVFTFGVFYSFTQVNPTKLKANFMHSNTYLLGVSYAQTENYLALSIVQLSMIGSAILAVMALIPYILGIDSIVSLISLLILVISLIELVRQIQGLRLKSSYSTKL